MFFIKFVFRIRTNVASIAMAEIELNLGNENDLEKIIIVLTQCKITMIMIKWPKKMKKNNIQQILKYNQVT